jgi:hypothetical protein
VLMYALIPMPSLCLAALAGTSSPPRQAVPEVLVINIIEVDNDGGEYADGGIYASEVLPFPINPIEYIGKKVLAVPRCCQYKKGT